MTKCVGEINRERENIRFMVSNFIDQNTHATLDKPKAWADCAIRESCFPLCRAIADAVLGVYTSDTASAKAMLEYVTRRDKTMTQIVSEYTRDQADIARSYVYSNLDSITNLVGGDIIAAVLDCKRIPDITEKVKSVYDWLTETNHEYTVAGEFREKILKASLQYSQYIRYIVLSYWDAEKKCIREQSIGIKPMTDADAELCKVITQCVLGSNVFSGAYKRYVSDIEKAIPQIAEDMAQSDASVRSAIARDSSALKECIPEWKIKQLFTGTLTDAAELAVALRRMVSEDKASKQWVNGNYVMPMWSKQESEPAACSAAAVADVLRVLQPYTKAEFAANAARLDSAAFAYLQYLLTYRNALHSADKEAFEVVSATLGLEITN